MNIENMTLLEAKNYCADRTDCANCADCILDRAGICDECIPHSWALTEEAQQELAKRIKEYGWRTPVRDSYTGGYKKALLDVVNWFSAHSEALKHYRLYSSKNIPKLLNALLENWEELMLTGDCQLTWNDKKKEVTQTKRREEVTP